MTKLKKHLKKNKASAILSTECKQKIMAILVEKHELGMKVYLGDIKNWQKIYDNVLCPEVRSNVKSYVDTKFLKDASNEIKAEAIEGNVKLDRLIRLMASVFKYKQEKVNHPH